MKKILFPFVILLSLIVVACNQSGNTGNNQGQGPGNFNAEEMVDRQMEELNEALDLSKKQDEQMREIMHEGIDKMMQMREEMRSGGGDFEGMRETMRAQREKQDAKVKDILSEDQFVKYQEIQEERRARRGQGRQGERPQ